MRVSIASLLLAVIGTGIPTACNTASRASMDYPVPHRGEVVDIYHGTPVADPYRWLEDTDSPETRQWIAAENKITFDYLESIPERQSIREHLTELWDYERYGVPFRRGGRYFLFKNNGLQNQSVLYTMEDREGEPRVLLDPNQLSEDGTVALSGTAVSDDGNLLAYAVSRSGSDWKEWKVREVESGRELTDHIQWSKFSRASWREDASGFYYSRYDAPAEGEEFEAANYHHQLYFHRLGTPQSEDTLVYHRPDKPEWGFDGEVTEDGNFLIITIWKGTDPKNRVYYRDLTKPDAPIVTLLDQFDAEYTFIGNEGPRFWFQTDRQAPRGKVIAIDIRHPEPAHWREIIPESKFTLESVNLVGNRFVARYLENAHSRVQMFDLEGGDLGAISLPGLGTAGGFRGRRGDNEVFYSFTSFNRPTTIFRYDFTSEDSAVFRRPLVEFSPENYEIRQVFYRSADGTPVPMFVACRKGLERDGNTPTLLYGYGGFGISLTPFFSVSNLIWMEMGGVFAMPNLRGGGEFGEEWHQAGTRLNKQNVFDDFIAAAEWLIAHDYTRPEKLAMAGGSNGGLLVGAVMTQRPDLFGAALPAVGVMDMLRFHKFTIGWAWVSDYGSSEDPEEFRALYAYSPLHNLRPRVDYPATLITTADHDDRVVPGHSFKFAATLQQMHKGPDPVLIRIETKAGHGAGKPTTKLIAEAADKLAFLVEELDMQREPSSPPPEQQ